MAQEPIKKKRGKRSPGKPNRAKSQPAIEPVLDRDSSMPSAIVGVGASAGGLAALEELFRNLPGGTSLAFVVVTHQHPGHDSLLRELLARVTDIPVLAADSGVKVQPDHIYVMQPGGQLCIEGGVLQRREEDNLIAPKMPIDYFLRSLARDQKQRAICIILSGTGTDGTFGLRDIKGEAGLVVVERPSAAQYAGMPASAVATGLADFVLQPAEMPQILVEYVRNPLWAEGIASNATGEIPPGPMQEIYLLLRNRTGHDFSAYKKNTIYRRIARRMSVRHINEYEKYILYLREHPDEIDTLFRELLINVTNFFRDPEAWEALIPHIHRMITSRQEDTVRVWIPGCSSGEEVFTMAILLHECMEACDRYLDVQIFGTDLDEEAIDKARTGRFPEGIADDLTPNRLQKYFIKEDGYYRIRKDIREMTVFAVQNAIKDPPFTKMDIISCRNMMIYFNSDIQRKLLPIFHYALKPGGLLFLGTAESIGSLTELFELLDKRWKIYRRSEGTLGNKILPEFPMQTLADGSREQATLPQRSLGRKPGISRLIEQALLHRFVPACVLINQRGDIAYVHGRIGAYLEPNEGQPRNNILDMAREGLQIELAEAINHCRTTDTEFVRTGILVKGNGDSHVVDMRVVKLHEPESLRELLLVAFNIPPAAPHAVFGKSLAAQSRAQDEDRVEQLERTLRFLRETHQATLEDLETSNEALEATNEELQSTNEELQSTNEELETSKEEMQSLNEELTTVNNELLSKVTDLSQANDDMQNLLNSTKIATVFLDEKLIIKRFTKQARDLVMIRQADLGRPISELASNIQHEDLAADCRNVLDSLVFKEAEVQTVDGAYYLMRIMPYRTAENAIDGLVMTFVDISLLKRTQKELRHMSEVFRESAEPIIIVDLQYRVVDLNDRAMQILGSKRDDILGTLVRAVFAQTKEPSIEALFQRCRDGERVSNVPCGIMQRSGEESPHLLTLNLLTAERGDVDGIAIVMKPVNDKERPSGKRTAQQD
jgi:two-component system CheB/CheR fusion protein